MARRQLPKMRFTGWWVSRELIECHAKNLTHLELIVCALLLRLMEKSGSTTASNKWIADAARTSTRNVIRTINKCEKLGIVRVKKLSSCSRIVFFVALRNKKSGDETVALQTKRTNDNSSPDFRSAGDNPSLVSPLTYVLNNSLLQRRKRCNGTTMFSRSASASGNEDVARMVGKLTGIVKASKTTATKIRPRTWGIHFQRLMMEDNVSSDKIHDVLDWYAVNCGKPYVPVVASAISFRRKFDALLQAIERSKPKSNNDNKQSNAELRTLYERIDALPQHAAEYIRAQLGTPRTFAKWWVGKSKSWKTKTFTRQHPAFVNRLESIINGYTTTAKATQWLNEITK